MPRIAKHMSNPYLQSIMAKYIAHKVKRKLKRLNEYNELEKRVNQWLKDNPQQ